MEMIFFLPLIVLSFSAAIWQVAQIDKLAWLKLPVIGLLGASIIVHFAGGLFLYKKINVKELDAADFMLLYLNYPEYHLTIFLGWISLTIQWVLFILKKLSAGLTGLFAAAVFLVHLAFELRIIWKSLVSYRGALATQDIVNAVYQTMHSAVAVSPFLLLPYVFYIFVTKKGNQPGG